MTWNEVVLEDGKRIRVQSGSNLLEVLRRLGKTVPADCGGLGTCGKCVALVNGNPVKTCQYEITEDIKVSLAAYGLEAVPTVNMAAKPLDLSRALAMAVDFGTTTVAGYLLDLETGECVAQASLANPQISFGADVISRCAYAQKHGREALSRPARKAVDELLKSLTSHVEAGKDRVERIVIAGNTAMHHLFFELPTEGLTIAPYEPVKKDTVRTKASDLGISAGEDTELIWLPLIGSFVGADTAACILAAGMGNSGGNLSCETEDRGFEGSALLIDIGTNGELVLFDGKSLTACSTAAGPAFEGAQIECGMRGMTGAIDHVFFDDSVADLSLKTCSSEEDASDTAFGGAGGVQDGSDDRVRHALSDSRITYSVVGGAEAKGICGSGLIDAVACLLESGRLETDGRLEEDFFFTEDIKVTQKDIRELQLAKGAVCAGIRMICRARDIEPSQIGRIYLAGAFGNYLDVEKACEIGLLPKDAAAKTRTLGNAAGMGACMAASSEDELRDCERSARITEHLNLASSADFNDIFLKSLDLVPLL